MSQLFVSKMKQQETVWAHKITYHYYGKLLKIHFLFYWGVPMVTYACPVPERHFYFKEFPQMEIFLCNIDSCLSSQICVFHLAVNISPILQGVSHSRNVCYTLRIQTSQPAFTVKTKTSVLRKMFFKYRKLSSVSTKFLWDLSAIS